MIEPTHRNAGVTLYTGDCLILLSQMPADSVDACVTDPPAGIGFMNKAWDGDKGGRDRWIEWLAERMTAVYRVLKPGGHAVVWSLPRTSHWAGTAMEDAGFEIRDVIAHMFGEGFPKSLDVSKAVDRAAGAEREVVGTRPFSATTSPLFRDDGWTPDNEKLRQITAPATDAARRWDGWHTALKPAAEYWWLARKPLSESTVAGNVLRHGVGALNIDGSRVAGVVPQVTQGVNRTGTSFRVATHVQESNPHPLGRWPANVVFSHGDCTPDTCTEGCPVALLDRQSGVSVSRGSGYDWQHSGNDNPAHVIPNIRSGARFEDTGTASRFFHSFPPDPDPFLYTAKASTSERSKGLEQFAEQEIGDGRTTPIDNAYQRGKTKRRNPHTTVKPLALMRHLVKLVTPPGGTVIDPFMGSGTTGIAANRLGMQFIGCDLSAEYVNVAWQRIVGDAPLLALLDGESA